MKIPVQSCSCSQILKEYSLGIIRFCNFDALSHIFKIYILSFQIQIKGIFFLIIIFAQLHEIKQIYSVG